MGRHKKNINSKSPSISEMNSEAVPQVLPTTSQNGQKSTAQTDQSVPNQSQADQNSSLVIESPSYGEFINVAKETNVDLLNKLQPIADLHNAALLAFIAPSFSKKVSPVDFQSASIGLRDELGLEEAIREIRKGVNPPEKLFLLIESPGGIVSSSYKIAYKLRKEFAHITSFVPHVAASGGTLIAVAANEVVMGEMANLTPIDIQVPYGKDGGRVSVNRMSSVLATLVEYFETKLPSQVPYPYRSMVDKLDPIIYDDWNSKTNSMIEYVSELLSKADYQSSNIIKIVMNLILTKQPHSFVIHRDRALEYGVKVTDEQTYINELNGMRWWLNNYMLSSGSNHYIRYVIPQKSQTVDADAPSGNGVAN